MPFDCHPLHGPARAPLRLAPIVMAGLAMLAILQPRTAQAADSVYSTVERKSDCTVLDKAAMGEGEWIRWRCPGPSGNFVFISEDDLRTSVAYGKPGLVNEWQSFTDFNHVGETIEWRRMDDLRPYAAIQRWFVSHGSADPRQVLVISTVAAAGEQSCMVGLVDASANRDANRLARRVADEKARRFRCARDEPKYYGDHAQAPPAP